MKKIFTYCLIASCFVLSAQKKDKILPQANEQFADKKYTDAEANYRIAQSKPSSSAVAPYNLGNAIYKQKLTSEAKGAYLKAIEKADTKTQKHYAYHNLGNVYMNEKKYDRAVEAYKNALRNNPADEQSRYNLALAKEFLDKNPPEDNKDDKKDQKKEEPKKDDKSKDKKQEEKKDNAQPKPKPGGISKERLQSLLEAVNNEEKKIQDKVNAKKEKAPSVENEKDW